MHRHGSLCRSNECFCRVFGGAAWLVCGLWCDRSANSRRLCSLKRLFVFVLARWTLVCCVTGANSVVGQVAPAGDPMSDSSKVLAALDQDSIGDGSQATNQFRQDSASIELSLPDQILRPGQATTAEIKLTVPPRLYGEPVSLIKELIRVGDNHRMTDSEVTIESAADGTVAPLTERIMVPAGSGVYEFRCRIEVASDRLWRRLRRKKESIASAGVPFVVHAVPTNRVASLLWTRETTVRPSDGRPWPFEQWLPESGTRLLPDAPPLTWSDIEQQNDLGTAKIAGREVTTIRPGKSFQLTLPRNHAGRLQRIRIRFPAKISNRFRLDVIDSKSGSTLVSAGVVEEQNQTEAFESTKWRSVLLHHYSGRRSETLRLTNVSGTQSAVFDSIEIDVATTKFLASDRQTIPPNRRGTRLILDNPDWTQFVTESIARDGTLNDFGPATGQLYRSYASITRTRDLILANEIDSLHIQTPQTKILQQLIDEMISSVGIPVEFDRAAEAVGGQVVLPNDSFEGQLRWPESESRTPFLIARHVVRLIGGSETDTLHTSGWRLLRPIASDELLVRRCFRSLPNNESQRIASVNSANQTKSVVVYSDGQDQYIRLVNFSVWESRVQLAFSSLPNSHQWIEADQVDQPLIAVETKQDRMSLTMQPGQLLVLKILGTDTRVIAWDSQPAGGAIAVGRIKQQVTTVVERLGMLSKTATVDVLDNPSFEEFGAVGMVGWLHSQHPVDSVSVDPRIAAHGKRSVRMRNSADVANPAWLVSKPIPIPATGRIAVSMALRGDDASGDRPHRIRVAVEGIVTGEPFRHAAEVLAPATGKWVERKIVLEADQLARINGSELRLAIDSLSSGSVWVDDIRIHDTFPLKKERDVLQSLSFLAVQGLQRGDLTPASRLLSKYWSRYLISLDLPATESAASSLRAADNVDETNAESDASVATKIKDWIPESLRF